MRGYNVISELYHGNLRPCDRSFRNDTDFAITMEAFAQQGDKLRELLTGESAERFDELMSCHNSIVDTMSMVQLCHALALNEPTFRRGEACI